LKEMTLTAPPAPDLAELIARLEKSGSKA
jgi:hypothetical protein